MCLRDRAGLTRALKEFAMRRGVAVVELVQAARESEGRRMCLRDMFGSATIEQDADGVLALEPQGEGAVSGGGSRDVRVSVLKWREGVACELRFAWHVMPIYFGILPIFYLWYASLELL